MIYEKENTTISSNFSSGSSGTSGSSGNTGSSGINGSNGVSGTPGINGENGSSGISGNTGSSGINGSNGVSGIPGINGENGSSGISGNIGLSGSSGTSGSSGSSGMNGDKYRTTSSSSFTLGNSGTINIGTGLGYSVAQSIIIVYDINNFQECEVLSYITATGIMTFNTPTRTVGSGTYTSWLINLDGASGGNGSSGTSGISSKYYSVSSSEVITTMSSSDEVIPGMSLISDVVGSYAVTFNAQYSIDPSDRTIQATTDMLNTYNTLISMASTETIASAIATRTFTPGVYTVAAAGTVAADIVITLNGNGIYVFRFGAALSMGANVNIILQNGALASDIFWIAEGAIAIGAGAHVSGCLISNSGAVDLAAGCYLVGKLLAIKSGAISISTSNIVNTGISSIINWNLISSFTIFSAGGVISNAGASNVSGDIGTKTGSITVASFSTSVFTGNYYTSMVGNAIASFSIYQNGILVENSKRTRNSTLNTVDVSVHAIASVNTGQNIEVRWSVDSGTLKLKSRILTIINVR
jgi:hypothetical protein